MKSVKRTKEEINAPWLWALQTYENTESMTKDCLNSRNIFWYNVWKIGKKHRKNGCSFVDNSCKRTNRNAKFRIHKMGNDVWKELKVSGKEEAKTYFSNVRNFTTFYCFRKQTSLEIVLSNTHLLFHSTAQCVSFRVISLRKKQCLFTILPYCLSLFLSN